MPRYHFHLHDGLSSPDEDGQELESWEDAKSEAVLLAGAAIKDLGPAFWTTGSWSLEITDGSGATLLILALSANLTLAAACHRQPQAHT